MLDPGFFGGAEELKLVSATLRPIIRRDHQQRADAEQRLVCRRPAEAGFCNRGSG